MEHVTTHVSDGLALPLSQFKTKPRLTGWLSALLSQVQQVEDALFNVYLLRMLADATAGQLDVIGELVGQSRNGAGDAEYRAYLGARIRTNNSGGHIEDLISIATLLVPGAIVVRETYPKAVDLEIVSDVLPANPTIVWRDFLEKAKPPGTFLRLIYSVELATGTFTWGSAYGGDAVTSAGEYWGSYYDATKGGYWAAVASE